MRRFFIVTITIFALCTTIVFIHYFVSYKKIFSNGFVERLRLDSKLVDGHWTWREIYPGHDTFDDAKRLLRRVSDDGFAKQMSVIEAEDQVNWVKFGSPLWTGTLRGNGDLPFSHVDAVILNLPEGYVQLSDALLIYGVPIIFPDSYGYRRVLCFPQGVCITTESDLQTNRMMPTDAVLSISYVTPHLMYASITDTKWQGFRRY